ncbi:MAG: hypothetical protein FJY88_05890 [Candidatus Eisenbacteria bacterium]|nr:hypothetical protein [Candidatus Eisenbacteria bacterium]
MRPPLILAACLPLLFLVSTPSSFAQIHDPEWDPEEIVDIGDLGMTGSSGPDAVHTPDWQPWNGRDEWHVVYEKRGDIYHAMRIAGIWQAPEPLTDDPAVSRDPKLAFIGDRLIVVWEDDRRGHPEIWARLWDGGSWGAEIALTDNMFRSSAPAIAGGQTEGYAVWEEGPEGLTTVAGRRYEALGRLWFGIETISPGGCTASEPSIACEPWSDQLIVAWADAMHGLPEIYLRERQWGGWAEPVRLTDLPGACRKPSVHAEQCCGDIVTSQALIAFEHEDSGPMEVWVGCFESGAPTWVQQVSPEDGRASRSPQMHGYTFVQMDMIGGVIPRYWITWTDDAPPGARSHQVGLIEICGAPSWSGTLSDAGIETSSIAGIEGSPMAGVLATWIEERQAATCLVAKPGSILGCQGFEFHAPLSILLTPAGSRDNAAVCSNACPGGGPVEGLVMTLSFAPPLDADLTWDEIQLHPTIPPETTDADGRVELRVRGGGCSTAGRVRLIANGLEVRNWLGAKSPDVNGDCAVLQNDLVYVMSRMGTADFCGDLDGSGLVDAADAAIVQASLGDLCSQLVSVEESADLASGIRIEPNPSRGTVVIRVDSAGSPDQKVEIFDAAGRLIRVLPERGQDGRGGAIIWDATDERGSAVSSGLYFARVSNVKEISARPIVIVR